MRGGSVTCGLALALFALLAPELSAKEIPGPLHAQQQIDAGDLEAAAKTLDRWLKKNPKDARGWLLRATVRLMSGDLAKGKSDLDRSIGLDPALRQAWLNRAALHLSQQNYDGAIADLLQAEKLEPSATDNSLNIGTAHLLGGDLQTANTRFSQYLAANPRNAEAYYTVASNYGLVGQVALAIQALGYAIQIDEKSRRRARVDANFEEVARDPRFQELLEADTYRPPAKALMASKTFDVAYSRRTPQLVQAILSVLQQSNQPFDPQVEVAETWALLWARFRIKVVQVDLATSRVELVAAPGAYSPKTWLRVSETFFRDLAIELVRVSTAAPG